MGILWLVVRRSVYIVAIAACVAGAGTVLVTRLLWAALLGVSSANPITWAVTTGLLGAVAVVASVGRHPGHPCRSVVALRAE